MMILRSLLWSCWLQIRDTRRAGHIPMPFSTIQYIQAQPGGAPNCILGVWNQRSSWSMPYNLRQVIKTFITNYYSSYPIHKPSMSFRYLEHSRNSCFVLSLLSLGRELHWHFKLYRKKNNIIKIGESGNDAKWLWMSANIAITTSPLTWSIKNQHRRVIYKKI